MSFRLNDPKYKVLDIPLNNHTEDLITKVVAISTALTYTVGPYGKSVGVFDGANTKITVLNNSNLQGLFNGGGTVSVMIKANSAGETNYGRIIDKLDEYYIIVRELAANKLKISFKHNFSGEDGIWTTTATELNVGVGTHFVITYNSSAVTNDPIMYLNSRMLVLTEMLTPTGTADNNTNDFIIGNTLTQSATWDGNISKVKAFKCMLTGDECIKLHNMDRRI